MARDRQRAKQRQAQRRAARQAEGGGRAPGAPRPDAGPDGVAGADGADGADTRAPRQTDAAGVAPGAGVGDPPIDAPGLDPRDGADLEASAPPETIGRSDTVVETPPPPLAADPESDPEAAASRGTVGEAGDEAADASKHGKVVAFLIAVWAELKRVQWPTRQQVITLTGIVLGFVVIMGAYLGALDAIFSRLVQLIL